jgi:predicted flavoprotein YhiN
MSLIPGFVKMNPNVDHKTLAKALKNWKIDIEGFVGYERCVITAGGVSLDDITPKTLESRIVPGLHFAGEVLDLDADTGGYNLQTAFSTGYLAGICAAKTL